MTISQYYEKYSRFYIPLLSETFSGDYNYYWATQENTLEKVTYSWHTHKKSHPLIRDTQIAKEYYEELFETPINTKLGQSLYGKME